MRLKVWVCTSCGNMRAFGDGAPSEIRCPSTFKPEVPFGNPVFVCGGIMSITDLTINSFLRTPNAEPEAQEPTPEAKA